MKIIECVPNFSEGRDKEKIEKIGNSLQQVSNCKLLNIDSDYDHNRTVVTFIGDEIGILKGSVTICKAAAGLIDMRFHKGEHPRIGAVDVVPFIPVRNTTMNECVSISKKFGEIISKELNIPVYLYSASARNEQRKELSNIRKGEYEGLQEKLIDSNWRPDFGNNIFNPKCGALVTGARNFLIAYNVNLKTNDVSIAKNISEAIRESGKNDKPGLLKCVKAIGIYLKSNNFCQVSMNLTNYKVTPLHAAYEEVKTQAKKINVEVIGSEIVGMVPLEAILDAGRYYLKSKNDSEDVLIDTAIDRLKLNSFYPFDKKKKIIDYIL
jgi:glutamate formiminotransferase / 5-formyltetrahydrofolate cyclo-ligase